MAWALAAVLARARVYVCVCWALGAASDSDRRPVLLLSSDVRSSDGVTVRIEAWGAHKCSQMQFERDIISRQVCSGG